MDSSTKALLSDDPEKGQETTEQPLRQIWRLNLLETICNAFDRLQRFLLLAVLMLCFILLWDDMSLRRNSWQRCLQDTASPSPALSLTTEYKTVKFNGSFAPDTQWRLPPGPEVDALWNSVAKTGEVVMSFDDVRAMGKVPEQMRRVPPALRPKIGDGILVVAEFGHQLHCLNMIRKFTFFDHYKTELLQENDNMNVLRTHVDHCIDLVRQALTCYADPGFVTSYWIDGRKLAMPDFSTVHKCRNIDAMIDWVDQHDVGEVELGPFADETVWTRQNHP